LSNYRCLFSFYNLTASPLARPAVKLTGLAALPFPLPVNFSATARHRITTAGELDYLEVIAYIVDIELDIYSDNSTARPTCVGEIEIRVGALIFENDTMRR
jgi:hypothetical protein